MSAERGLRTWYEGMLEAEALAVGKSVVYRKCNVLLQVGKSEDFLVSVNCEVIMVQKKGSFLIASESAVSGKNIYKKKAHTSSSIVY